jgi:hypothetical protein
MTVGRLPSCEFRFEDPYLSRTRAALWQQGGVDYLEDPGSAGGTFVNGEAITVPRRLYPGDRVAFADLQLRYDTGEGAGCVVVTFRSSHVTLARAGSTRSLWKSRGRLAMLRRT